MESDIQARQLGYRSADAWLDEVAAELECGPVRPGRLDQYWAIFGAAQPAAIDPKTKGLVTAYYAAAWEVLHEAGWIDKDDRMLTLAATRILLDYHETLDRQSGQ